MNISIRKLQPGDHHEIYAIVARNREHLHNLKWVESATLEGVESYLAEAQLKEIIRAIIVDEQIAGLITLRDECDHHTIGYWLDEQHCNKGVMTDAVRQICRLVKAPVYATIRVINERSRRVLLKNGFVKVSTEGEWDWYRKIN